MEFKIPADTAMMAFYLHRIYNFNLSPHTPRAGSSANSGAHSTSDSGEDNEGGHWADTWTPSPVSPVITTKITRDTVTVWL